MLFLLKIVKQGMVVAVITSNSKEISALHVVLFLVFLF